MWAVALFGAALPWPGLATGIATLAAALFVMRIGWDAVNEAANAQAVAVEHRYGRPIMASFHAAFSLGGSSARSSGDWRRRDRCRRGFTSQ